MDLEKGCQHFLSNLQYFLDFFKDIVLTDFIIYNTIHKDFLFPMTHPRSRHYYCSIVQTRKLSLPNPYVSELQHCLWEEFWKTHLPAPCYISDLIGTLCRQLALLWPQHANLRLTQWEEN